MTKPAAVPNKPRLIEIFRAGRRRDSKGHVHDFSAADLQAIAQSYDPQLSQAPLVVGHPKTDDPAYGWVSRVVVQGDSLYVEEEQVEPQFNEMRNAGRFKNRSASFYHPESPSNPTPGKFYLKHVGWLGATPPAVKGLKHYEFAADDDGVVEFALSDRRWGFRTASDLFQRFRDWLIDEKGLDKADEVLPRWMIDSLNEAGQPDSASTFTEPTEEPAVSKEPNDFAERDTALKQREDAVAAAEQRIAAHALAARRTEAAEFAEGLVKDGKLLPKQKAAAVELLLLQPADTSVSFGEGDDRVEKPPVALLRELLSERPAQISFSERSGGGGEHLESVEFAAPNGAHVHADKAQLHAKAKAYQKEHPNTSWLDAVQAVGG
ncbi:hypothetical protein ACTJI2_13695 [Pseudoxanthomonas sp. 22568]|uniref:hypothetical protein n=1 Tax=Pseudoxanthomonas sp. 22568 TaxID=3453945 RepID=UPI003F879E59